MKKAAYYILCILLLSGCDLFRKKDEEPVAQTQEKPLARVLNKYLYYSDVEGIQGKNFSKEDSAAVVSSYINSWIQKQLLLTRAEATVDENSEDVRNKLEDCKNTIMIYEFEREYLKQRLDTLISEKTLRDYYEAHIENFHLKQNIFKGLFLKIPKNAPDLAKVKGMVASGKSKDIQELKSYCVRFADYYTLEDTIWINFDEVVKNTPFADVQDKGEFLEKNRFAEMQDNKYVYLLRVKDYKISKEISPFEFAVEQIRGILVNKRRIALINELKQSIYKEAKNNNEFEVYNQK